MSSLASVSRSSSDMSAAMASRNSFLAFAWSGFFSSQSAGFLFASRIRCADSDTGACASRAARPAAPGVLTVLPGGTSAGPVGRGFGVVGTGLPVIEASFARASPSAVSSAGVLGRSITAALS